MLKVQIVATEGGPFPAGEVLAEIEDAAFANYVWDRIEDKQGMNPLPSSRRTAASNYLRIYKTFGGRNVDLIPE